MAFMTRVAVETLAVSSSLSACKVSGSLFTVSTLMSSLRRVTSFRPRDSGGLSTDNIPAPICSPIHICNPPTPLTSFPTPVEEAGECHEEADDEDAGPNGGPGDDANRQDLCRE